VKQHDNLHTIQMYCVTAARVRWMDQCMHVRPRMHAYDCPKLYGLNDPIAVGS
jgi:hypothetical protein